MANLDYLYKYTSFEAAHNILSTKSLRWSVPDEFNDPYDCMVRMTSYSEDEYAEVFADIMCKECNSEVQIRIPPTNIHYERVKSVRSLNVINRDLEVAKLSAKIRYDTKEVYLKYIDKLEKEWQNFRKIHIVILCLTELDKNVSMWSLYAESHKGVVLRFKRTNHRNSLVSNADRVTYGDEIFTISTDPISAVNDVLDINAVDQRDRYQQAICSKRTIWKEEKEWRCIGKSILPNILQTKHEFREFKANELDAIYFGCKMEPEEQEYLKELLKEDFKHVEMYKAVMDKNAFDIHYERL